MSADAGIPADAGIAPDASVSPDAGTPVDAGSAIAPTVTTMAATGVGVSGATLNATGNPNGASATGWFRYATTSPGFCNDTFGTRTPTAGGTPLGSGGNPVAFLQQATGLTPNVTYYFCALASNAGGTGVGSLLTFLVDTLPPSTPTGLVATPVAGGMEIDLTWTASTDNVGVTGYQVMRCQGSGCSPATKVATSVSASDADQGLTPRTTYGYAIAAYDAAGNVSASSSPPVYAVTLAPNPVQMGVTTLLSNPDSNTLTIAGQPFTATATGALVSLSLYIDSTSSGPDSIELGLYSNNAGAPATLLAATTSVTNPPAGAWLTLAATGATVTNGQTYWLVYEVSGNSVTYRTGTVSGVLACGGTISSYGAMPSMFPSPSCPSGDPWSFYATVQP